TIAEKDKELDDLRKMIDLTAREKDARISDLKEQLGFLQLQYGMLNDRMLTITNRLLPEGSTKKRWQFWKRRQPQIVTEGR
ncbi:MAG: hypothetical protein ACXVIF_03675, partial [Halobacteriota archaeon]